MTENSQDVTFPLSGVAHREVCDGNWRNDNPRGFARIEAAPMRRVGKGYQLIVNMDEHDAADLADYLESVADVWECMTTEERGGSDPRAIRVAVATIRRKLAR